MSMIRVSRRAMVTAALAAPILTSCSSASDDSATDLTVSSAELSIALGQRAASRLAASGGHPPYRWKAVAGGVPGLTLSADGLISGTPKRAGHFWASVQATDASGAVSSVTPINVTVNAHPGAATADVLAVGTSLSASISNVKPWTTNWPLLTQRQARTWGWPGRNSDEIAARWGAVPYRLAQGAEIPASGSVVLTLDRPTIRETVPATISGIRGTMNVADAHDPLSQKVKFTRIERGAAARVPQGGELRREFDLRPYAGWSVVLEAARNDNPIEPGGIDRVVSNYRAMLSHFGQGTTQPRALVAGQPLATWDDAAAKSSRLASNAALKAAFPQQYVDPWGYIRSDDCANFLGIKWTDQDKKDIAAGITPHRLRLDNLHPNSDAHRAIAHFYQREMLKRSWL